MSGWGSEAGTPVCALVSLSGVSQILTTGVIAEIIYDTLEFDFGGLWKNNNTGRLYVPTGFTWARASMNGVIGVTPADPNQTVGFREFSIRKNGNPFLVPRPTIITQAVTDATESEVQANVSLPWIKVIGGTDYFSVWLKQNSGSDQQVPSSEFSQYFHLEVK